MVDISVPEAVFRLIRERREQCVEIMTNGNIKSMEHYREIMGNLEGLAYVEQELKSLLNKQERSDD